MKKLFLLMSILTLGNACKKSVEKVENKVTEENTITTQNKVKITPIAHATAVLEFNNQVIYLDPTGGAEAFKDFKSPDFVVITDIHGDHMNMNTLNELNLKNCTIITCKAVAKEIKIIDAKEVVIINNGEQKSFDKFSIEAIPMYNLREEAIKFHKKGRGNGYIFTIHEERIYFSGDTEDIPEMRNLKNIDKAFVCMNLPYTMTVESAADAVLAFKPKQVYPYHYRGSGGFSDVAKFKSIVNKNDASIDVIQLNWYPKKK